MTDRDGLLQAILENPADDTPRLIYADCIEDAGEAVRAEYIRNACELAKWSGSILVSADARALVGNLMARQQELEDTLEMRCAASEFAGHLGLTGFYHDHGFHGGMNGIRWEWSRGFVNRLAISGRDWMQHHAKVYWHKDQKERCRFCFGTGHRVELDYQCGCERGWFPRPLAPSAHPLERVTLTSSPEPAWCKSLWPAIAFDVHLGGTVRFSNVNANSVPPSHRRQRMSPNRGLTQQEAVMVANAERFIADSMDDDEYD